jgi:hypothetical protein
MTIRVHAVSLLSVLALAAAGSSSLVAQEPLQSAPKQVISANPFGLLLELFNAEYERVISESSTAGVGGSTFFGGDDDYINADVFWRLYPSGNPLNGWAFGAKAGVTNLPDHGTYFGFGFDVNRSWVLGKRNNYYVGIGLGLKRLIGAGDQAFELEYIPTFRIVNVGIAF